VTYPHLLSFVFKTGFIDIDEEISEKVQKEEKNGRLLYIS